MQSGINPLFINFFILKEFPDVLSMEELSCQQSLSQPELQSCQVVSPWMERVEQPCGAVGAESFKKRWILTILSWKSCREVRSAFGASELL